MLGDAIGFRVGHFCLQETGAAFSVRPLAVTRQLEFLAERSGEAISPQIIIDHLWPNRSWATAQDVKQLVYLLRQKVEHDSSTPHFMRTVRGFGYMLAEQDRV